MNVIKYLFNWKYRYFARKLWGVEKMILDHEFKRYKLFELKEEERLEYDQVRNRLSVLETQIKAEDEKPTLTIDERARVDDQKVLFERDINKRKEEMDRLTIEVNGSKPTNEIPDGFQGVEQYLENLHELTGMIKQYLRIL